MRNPQRILLNSVFATNVGNAAQTLALGKLLYDQTGTIAAFGAVIVFEYVVTVVTNLIAGSITDRVDPLRTCKLIDMARGLLVVVMSLALAATGSIIWVFLITACIQSTRPFYKSSFVRVQLDIVPPEARAGFNGHVSAVFQAGQLTGIFTATALIGLVGPIAGITLNGMSFILSAMLLGRLSMSATSKPKTDTQQIQSIRRTIYQIWDDWYQTLLYVRRDPILAAFTVASTLDLIAAAMLNLLLVPIAYGVFGTNPIWLGTLDGLFAVGAIAAGLLSGRIAKAFDPVHSPVLCMLGQAALFLLLATMPPGPVFLTAMFGFGALNSLSWSHAATLLQNRMAEDMRGRITVLRFIIGAIVGAVAMSFLSSAESGGLSSALGLAGLLMLVGSTIPASAWIMHVREQKRSINCTKRKA